MQTSATGERIAAEPELPELLAASDALKILGLKSRTSLQMLVLTGKLTPAATVPLGNLYRRSDVEALAASRRASAEATS